MSLQAYVQSYLVGLILGGLIYGGIFAFACYKIVQNKGYPPDSCSRNAAGGFFLSWIWLIVVLCKPALSTAGSQETHREYASSNSAIDYGGMSLHAFIISTLIGILLSLAGIFVFVKIAWWGVALFGAGLGVLTIVHNKV